MDKLGGLKLLGVVAVLGAFYLQENQRNGGKLYGGDKAFREEVESGS